MVPQEEKKVRDLLRAQVMRYNDRDSDTGTGNDTFTPDSIELDSANEMGYFEGLEDGFLGGG